ncbi:fimbrial protein [Erwinia sp. JUb26]|uniref:fimbrial protein n=1 Tax=Erwinia sp. JUb26 TaxID=2485126 RepID=UPI000F490800|nr:fimbrial protein [Erwinia sp. JUb26]ROR08831.1 type 1 fimbria pilin [Erwinia sp. JUb26]
MELKKIVLGVALAMGMTGFAQAAAGDPTPTDQGSGSFTFKGSIIDAPCSIAGNKDQVVEMGQISNAALINGDQRSVARDFSIKLEKCVITDKKSVSVTFTGPKGTIPDSLGMGKVTGASLIMNDGNNQQIKLAEPTNLQDLANGDNTLSFSAFVQGNPGVTEVELGEFTAVTNFTLAYQ